MALRVTQGLMYNSFVGGMNRTLSDLMESNIQSTSQKKVNRPSDDPVAAGRILASRGTLDKLSTYDGNIKMAMGWLNLADNILAAGDGSVQTVLTRIKTLATDMASGDVTAENRLQTSYEVRTLFQQIVGLANTSYAGNQIFGGHKTKQPSYVEGLAVTCLEGGGGTINEAQFHVEGAAARTVVIQVTDGADAESATYRYSEDGGATWVEGLTMTQPLNADGSGTLDLGNGIKITVNDPSLSVTPVDISNDHSNDNGTWMYVRPTAIYQGDDHDTQVSYSYGTSAAATPEGHFSRDVAVRIDTIDGTATPPTITYSYSVDDGSNWTQATAPYDSASLPVPGGYLNFDPSDMPVEGNQFIIHPHRADIKYQIGDDDYITVNMVGKDIFGGYYNYPGDRIDPDDPTSDLIDYPVRVDGQPNLFETIGDLIAALETNSQQGVQESLPKLEEAMTLLLTRVAEVGGRENRLITSQAAIVMRTYSEEDNLSNIEDVDVTELMTRLAQQQVAYNSVLKSSSMIMQMSLVNFL